MIEAKVIADSISPTGQRLITVEANVHRFILAELNTHRQFSRNSASSRAIPVTKQLDWINSEPAWPIEWTSEQAGMSGGDNLNDEDIGYAMDLFLRIKDYTTDEIQKYIERFPKERRLHKSLLNRLLEPFMWHRVIITATEWENFFDLRCHQDAQPEIREAAMHIRHVVYRSRPKELDYGQWHMPYISDKERDPFNEAVLKKVSAARCARVSYLTHDGKRDMFKDTELYNKLTTAEPPHKSPLEHVATPAKPKKWYTPTRREVLGNFNGWHQLRHNLDMIGSK